MTPTLTPTYEVYPGTPPDTFKAQFLSKRILLESFCMKERIDPPFLPVFIDDILIDWELTEQTHRDYTDASRHLINHLRIKLREPRNLHQTGSQPSGRGQHRNPTTLDLAQAILARSSGSGN